MRIKASHVLNSQKLAAVWLGACLCLSANLLPKSGLSAWAAKKEKPAAQAEQVGPPEAAKQESPADQAITLFNQGVELFQVGQVQAEKGNLNGQRQLLREAVKRFEQALALDSTMVDAQSNIGFAYLTLQDRKRAVREFNKALAMNDKHLNTLNGLSTAYALDGKIDDALKTFEKLTTLDPGNAQYFFNKGSALQKAGRLEEAKAAYEAALKLEPEDQRTLFNLGTLYENMGEFAQAIVYYNHAKKAEVGNTVGLEAIRRVKALEANQPKSSSEAQP